MDLPDLSKINVSQLFKNKNIMANIGIIVLTLFVTMNLHKAQLQRINVLKNKISEEGEISGFLGEIKTLEDEFNTFKSNLPVDLTSDIAIEKVSSIARKHDVRIASIDSQALIDKGIYISLPLRVELRTDYHSLGHLISDIEKTGIFKVKRLSLKAARRSISDRQGESDFSLELMAATLKK
ncbi:MAG: type 4a pilus biogenesis protein PilO [Candidatus Omnitrophota bacterium]